LRRTSLVAVALACAAATTALVGLAHRSPRPAGPVTRSPSLAADVSGLPAPQRPAFTVATPKLLNRREWRARFAPVVRRVEARRTPAAHAAPIAPIALETPEGTTNVVLVVGDRLRADGLWVRVRLPVLPNNQTGWVPRRALGGYVFVHTHLVVDRARFTAVLYDDTRRVFEARVGIGTPASPTPAGEYYVRNRLSGFGNPFYGPVAFGTSARSAVLTDWPGGGFIGIHGTNEPALIPGRISHGCVRMRNADILRLSRLMPVGTPVSIR